MNSRPGALLFAGRAAGFRLSAFGWRLQSCGDSRSCRLDSHDIEAPRTEASERNKREFAP